MARAARMAARQGREAISEDDIYAAMENKAMEAYAVSIGCCSVLSLLHTFHQGVNKWRECHSSLSDPKPKLFLAGVTLFFC
jgi:hypothetical protein